MRWLMRRLLRAVVVLAVVFVAAYAGDFAVFKLRGSPQSTVTINSFVSIPLKGNKTEFDYLGSMPVPCSISLFPQAGQSPCWQLRRHVNQGTNL
jgi:hypothetical protein